MTSVETPMVQLSARDLTRHFTSRTHGSTGHARRAVNHAVDGVSLDLIAGRITAVVGESGSGKSVLARMLARIVVPSSGELSFQGVPIPSRAKRTLDYASKVQMVLQDPFTSINPVRPVRSSLERPLILHGAKKSDVGELAMAALARVSLEPPERFLDRYPHELSGGQLQRVSIARSLCVKPKVLLADEPISMLDVSVRLGILNLLKGLCDNDRLAIMYITHDIASARYLADETIVMYAGQVVERSRGTTLVDHPAHPYTQLLIASVPNPEDPTSQATLKSEHASFEVAKEGCRFAPRCPFAMDICRKSDPPDFVVGEGHSSHCWKYASEPEAGVEVAVPERRWGEEGSMKP